MRQTGSVPVFLLLAACATAPDISGTYETVLPAASGGGERHVALILEKDGSATLASAFSGRPSRFLVKGTWERKGAQVGLSTIDEWMLFDYADGRLVAREWDRTRWGEAGPGTLRRR